MYTLALHNTRSNVETTMEVTYSALFSLLEVHDYEARTRQHHQMRIRQLLAGEEIAYTIGGGYSVNLRIIKHGYQNTNSNQ